MQLVSIFLAGLLALLTASAGAAPSPAASAQTEGIVNISSDLSHFDTAAFEQSHQALATKGTKFEKCTSKRKLHRKAWHTLTTKEKKAYIDAELCLMNKTAASTRVGVVNRWDDMVAIHRDQMLRIHGTAWFLPWHRLYMHAHEMLLRDECGYKGAQPYWNWWVDGREKFSASSVFDPITGFGAGITRCITDGPFVNITLNVGPGGDINTPHCISRSIDDDIVSEFGADPDFCLQRPNFEEAWSCLEGAVHVTGHFGVNGEMANVYTSPGDPLFYLHHTYIDKLWYDWQSQNITTRLTEINGSTWPWGFPHVEVTLKDVLDMSGILGYNATVREAMNFGGDMMCYEYVQS